MANREKFIEVLPLGESNYKPVTRRIVFPLVLSDENSTGLIVSLALTATAPLDLIALRIRLVFRKLDARHLDGVLS